MAEGGTLNNRPRFDNIRPQQQRQQLGQQNQNLRTRYPANNNNQGNW
jgi:hypothetical protein